MYLITFFMIVAGPAFSQDAPMVEGETTPLAPVESPAPVEAPVAPTPAPMQVMPAQPAQPVAPPNTLWLPFEREAPMHADGASALCEGVLLPLLIIPGISEVASIVTDLACIVPAALALDHWAIHHGGRNAHTWQAVVALLTRRLVQTLLDIPQLAVLGAGVFAGAVAGGLALQLYPGIPTATIFAMIAIGGLLGYGLLNVVSDEVGDWLFTSLYRGLTDVTDLEEQAELKKNSWTTPPHQGFVAWYSTLSLLAGTKPVFDYGQLIPVVGAWQRTHDRAEVQKMRLHRFAAEDLQADRSDWAPVDGAIDAFAHVSGGLMGASHVFFIGAAATLITSTIIAGNRDNKGVAETVGWGGIGVAAVGGTALVLSSLTMRLEPFVVGAMYEATRDRVAPTMTTTTTTTTTGVE